MRQKVATIRTGIVKTCQMGAPTDSTGAATGTIRNEMIKLLLLLALTLSLSGCSVSSFIRTKSDSNKEAGSLTGLWVGYAEYRGAQLTSSVLFVHNAQGISATISTPDAYQLDAPLLNVRYDHPDLHFEVEEAGERLIFEGKRNGKLLTARLALVNCKRSLHSNGPALSKLSTIGKKISVSVTAILN